MTDGLDRARYLELSHILAGRPRTLVNLGVLVVVAGGAALAWWLSARGWPAWVLSQLLLATVFFQAFALLHECAHGSASR